MRSLLAFLSATLLATSTAAQVSPLPTTETAARETIASVTMPQAWLVQPVWRCPQRNLSAQRATAEIQQQMTALGLQGWELVSFGQANVDGTHCFFAMLKRPKLP